MRWRAMGIYISPTSPWAQAYKRRVHAVMEVKAHHGGCAELRGDIAIAPHTAAGVEDPLPGEKRGREVVVGKLLEERGLRPIKLSQAAVCGPFEPKRLSSFAYSF